MKKVFSLLLISSAVFVACNSSSTSNEKKEEPKSTAATDSLVNNGGDATSEYQKGAELIASNDCLTCHKVNEKNIGPAYMDVSKKYDATDANINNLAHKVITGGQGTWGNVPMTPHPNLSLDDAKEMVKYILSLKNQ